MYPIKILIIIVFFLHFFQNVVKASPDFNKKIKIFTENHYHNLEQNNTDYLLPNKRVFEIAITGYLNLKEKSKLNEDKQLVSIIDFSKKSSEKRYWLIDLQSDKILYHSLVAHGKNTGFDIARHFSNVPNSHRSSLGFYTTGATYFGKHGLSLYLHGRDKGFNDKAKKRAIVIHGANYVSEQFVSLHGRLGRSLGCPALPMSNYKQIINSIKGGTCLFIYYPSQDYFQNSTVLSSTNNSNEDI